MGWLIGIGALQLAMLVYIAFRLERLVDERLAVRLTNLIVEALGDRSSRNSAPGR